MGVRPGPVGVPEVDAISISGTKMTASAAELNMLDGVSGLVKADFTKLAAIVASQAELDTMDGITATTAEINKIDGFTGDVADLNSLAGVGAVGQVISEMVTFTENTVNGTFTGTIVVPAGSYLIDVIVHSVALWNDGAGATMIVGDTADPNGFFDAIDLRATDLLAGEQISMGITGGKEGADFDGGESAGDHLRRRYLSGARNVIGVVTATTKDGTTGVTHMVVVYVTPTNVAATASG